ncbi:hypothetical protein [Fusibacter ferrireducens]|uniref:Uncharacterized protein n=1 Tax=Fusibacter ferrireducens TaxID=2785058 RepID=A0ABR9ZT43_9FIRM|nr:hypothetical protein [Fusibacter ferrireducens]MBF4693629.1 hypothetical protein [Fusibacter ferrireducens]
MSKLTQFLNLFKYERTTDNQQTFNIETALNDNWDKVDEAVKTLDTELTSVEDRTAVIENKIDTPDFGVATINQDAISVTAEDSFKGVSQLAKFGGGTLYNAVKNGDFGDGTAGWTSPSAVLSASNNILSVTCNGTVAEGQARYLFGDELKNSDNKFFRIRVRVTNSNCTLLLFRMGDSGTIASVSNPVENTWYTLFGFYSYEIIVSGGEQLRVYHSYADAATANGKVMEVDGNAGVFTIPITGTPYESYTADQMNSVVEEYFEGLHSTQRCSVLCRGINKFDNIMEFGSYSSTNGLPVTSSVNIRNKNPIPINVGIYKISNLPATGDKWGVLYDSNLSFLNFFYIGANTSGTVTVSQNGFFNFYIMGGVSLTQQVMLNEGSTALPYEQFDGSTLTLTATDPEKFEWSQVGIKNNSSEILNGEFLTNKHIESYTLKAGDVVWEDTGTTVDRGYILRSLLSGIYIQPSGVTQLRILISNFRPNDTISSWDDPIYEYTFFDSLSFSSSIYLIFPESLFTNQTECDNYFVGKKIYYWLQQPLTYTESELPQIGVTVEGNLTALLDGTREFIAHDYDILPSSIEIEYPRNINQAVTNNALAVKSLELQVDGKASKIQEDWIAPTLLNGWVNYGLTYETAGYYKDDFGVVHLKGLIKNGITTPGTTLFTLPTGYRTNLNKDIVTISNSVEAIIRIYSSGNVGIIKGQTADFSMDNISFRAEV